MKQIFILTKYELLKFWSLSRIIVIMILSSLLIFFMFMPYFFGINFQELNIDVYNILQGLLSFFVPISVLFFTGAIIFSDKRSFYLRTILSRPVTRQEYLLSKYLTSFINLIIFTIFFSIIPTIISQFIYQNSSNLSIFSYLLTYFLYILEGILFISISISFSFFLNSYLNVFVLAIWLFLENTFINGILSNFVSFNIYIAIFSDFFFPSGFSEAVKLSQSFGLLFWESFFWGLSALTFFLALSFYLNSKTKIDIISE